ncbi:MAG: GNAT family protein [Pseudomonadota bacterium]
MAPLQGRYARLEALDAERHAALLYRAFDGHDWLWDYMPVGPFASAAQFHKWMRGATGAGDDIRFYAIEDHDAGQFGGFASYLRIKPDSGSIEMGFIAMAPQLQRTRAATEAFYLMMKWAFDAGYRRFEWKCDALNTPSRRAAQRLGFSYEGIFRQATVIKGRNRDTAWFAVIDREWPALSEAFEIWLAPGNFDAAGQQRERLSDLTKLVRAAGDPDLT